VATALNEKDTELHLNIGQDFRITNTGLVGHVNYAGIGQKDMASEFLHELELLLRKYEVIKLDVAFDPYQFQIKVASNG